VIFVPGLVCILQQKREAMRKLASIALSLLLSAGTALVDSPKNAPKDAARAAKPAPPAKAAPAKTSAEIAAEVEELRQTLQVQQKELQAQQEELQRVKEELAKRGVLNGSKTSAEAQPNQAQSQQQVTDSVPSRR
jgi:Skp family chaperone for outer membrane proteins